MSPDRYVADIPDEPEGLRIVIDKDGDAWQRVPNPENSRGTVWRCVKPKVPGMFTSATAASWNTLVVNFGPLDPVSWG